MAATPIRPVAERLARDPFDTPFPLHTLEMARNPNHHSADESIIMDKKTKKRLEVLNQRLQKLRQRVAGARKQNDEPGEVERLEAEIDAVEKEINQLKKS